MVCTSDELLNWKDFPKGLRVLLLDQDTNFTRETRSKLEEMDYFVSTFDDENEAILAISSKTEIFHIAIVEVDIGNGNGGGFKFLESAKDLPTIMMSNAHCLNTVMKYIALGAVEFLIKPLSEDKLRNIWQHVVQKAFNAGGKVMVPEDKITIEAKNVTQTEDNCEELSEESDKYPAPSTPQLKQGARLTDDGDCPEQTNLSVEKEIGEQDVESKSVETTTCDDSISEGVVKEEKDVQDIPTGINSLREPKSNRKKVKVDWTPELHKKFVQAVEKLGVDQAIPSRILELMKVEGLTRHNVASHLQKYRMQRRHILPKEDDRRFVRPRDSTQRVYYPHKPIMAFPPYHSNHAPPPAGQVYPAWGPQGIQMWGPPYYPPWQAAESWHWKPYVGMHAEAWGCPVMPPPLMPHPLPTHNRFDGAGSTHNNGITPPNSFDFHPAEEVIDRVVKEAINKPWLPLPLGLKPPSTESVLTELSKQGIPTIPPTHCRPL